MLLIQLGDKCVVPSILRVPLICDRLVSLPDL